ncbi:MAG: hemolysin family protein [bacterium]|nr:hemolysin family protein [bacterium]
MEFVIILFLILLNGVLAMSEIAIVSSRKVRLQQQAEEGKASAQTALDLANNPNRFLSTVQIGISLIGVLQGAFAGTALADDVASVIGRVEPLRPYSQQIGFTLIVLVTTYLSLIFGELVPKRLGIQSPESVARMVAVPMRTLSRLTYPLVWLLSISTELVLRLLGAKESQEAHVTEEEINVMLAQGAEAGFFEKAEQEMVASVFRLGDLRASALMTPRTDMFYFEVGEAKESIQAKLEQSDYSRFPVCEGGLDHVLGIISTKDLLRQLLSGQPIDLRAYLMPVPFIPETATGADVLEALRGQESQLALVIGEYGSVEGVVTVNDILEAIVGTLDDEPEAVQRADGSWLVDGMIPVEEFKDLVEIKDDLPGEDENLFQTLAGFIMAQQGKVPRVSDHFEWNGFYFEVVDMDGNRVDKVLVQHRPKEPDEKYRTGEIRPIRDDAPRP